MSSVAPALRDTIASAKRRDVLFVALGVAALLFAACTFVALFIDMVGDGWQRLNGDFFTQFASRRAERARERSLALHCPAPAPTLTPSASAPAPASTVIGKPAEPRQVEEPDDGEPDDGVPMAPMLLGPPPIPPPGPLPGAPLTAPPSPPSPR